MPSCTQAVGTGARTARSVGVNLEGSWLQRNKNGSIWDVLLHQEKQEWLDLGCPFTSGETRMARFGMSFYIRRNKNGSICDVILCQEKQNWLDLWCHFTLGAVGWMCRVCLGFAVGCMGQLHAVLTGICSRLHGTASCRAWLRTSAGQLWPLEFQMCPGRSLPEVQVPGPGRWGCRDVHVTADIWPWYLFFAPSSLSRQISACFVPKAKDVGVQIYTAHFSPQLKWYI